MEHDDGAWGHAEGSLRKSCGAGWPCVGGWGAGRRLLEATLGHLGPVSPERQTYIYLNIPSEWYPQNN